MAQSTDPPVNFRVASQKLRVVLGQKIVQAYVALQIGRPVNKLDDRYFGGRDWNNRE